MNRLPVLILVGLFLGFLFVAIRLLLLLQTPKLAKFETSFWFWHSPYSLSIADEETLKRIRVKQLFVRAGTFTNDGTNLSLILPQTYGPGSNRFPVHLVFNADSGVTKNFGEFELDTIVPQISRAILSQVGAAKKRGLTIRGVQLDIDCPTRLLNRYQRLIQRLRASDVQFKKSGPLQISITGLTSWLASDGAVELSRELDFMIPQAYEGSTGLKLPDVKPIFQAQELDRALRLATRLECPYWIGIPSYGRAFLFDDRQQLVGTYPGLEPQEALIHPNFKLAEHRPLANETLSIFRATSAAPDGRGKGYSLAFTLPTPEMLRQALALIENHRESGFQGIAIFRFPTPNTAFTLPIQTVERLIAKQEVKPRITLKARTSSNPFSLLDQPNENQQRHPPVDLIFEIENLGDAPCGFQTGAVEIIVQVDRPGVESVRLRDFDEVSYETDNGSTPVRPNRSNRIILRKSFVGVGGKATVGPIRLMNSLVDSGYRVSGTFLSGSAKQERIVIPTPDLNDQAKTQAKKRPLHDLDWPF